MGLSPNEIGAQILEIDNWASFRGYGPLPGIREARFRRRADTVVGTQIEVTNRDGSSHVEEIVHWLDTGGITLRMSEFSAPMSQFASHFVERWQFQALGEGFAVVRSFELHPTSRWGRLLLCLIAPLLRRAVDRHLDDMERRKPSLMRLEGT